MRTLVSEWSSELYDLQKICDLVVQEQQVHSDSDLFFSLALLYSRQGKHEKAVDILIDIHSADSIEYVSKYGQLKAAAKRASELVDIDEVASINLLVDNYTEAAPDQVVLSFLKELMPSYDFGSKHTPKCIGEALNKSSKNKGRQLYNYLERLHRKDSNAAATYDTFMVELAAKFDTANLLKLLQSSNSYALDVALTVCESRKLVPEQVYVLGRMGSASKAMNLIVNDLRDVAAAVKFASEQMDKNLWQELVSLAKNDGEIISQLLDFVGGVVNPYDVLTSLPDEMKVPQLKEKILCAAKSIREEISLQSSCLMTVNSDCFLLLTLLCRQLKSSIEDVKWDAIKEIDEDEDSIPDISMFGTY